MKKRTLLCFVLLAAVIGTVGLVIYYTTNRPAPSEKSITRDKDFYVGVWSAYRIESGEKVAVTRFGADGVVKAIVGGREYVGDWQFGNDILCQLGDKRVYFRLFGSMLRTNCFPNDSEYFVWTKDVE